MHPAGIRRECLSSCLRPICVEMHRIRKGRQQLRAASAPCIGGRERLGLQPMRPVAWELFPPISPPRVPARPRFGNVPDACWQRHGQVMLLYSRTSSGATARIDIGHCCQSAPLFLCPSDQMASIAAQAAVKVDCRPMRLSHAELWSPFRCALCANDSQ
jgi:hypothetical protein